MRNLELFSTVSIDHLLWSSDEDTAKLNSPALSIFTDFDHSQPMVIDACTTAVNALEIMEKTHSFMRLVVDKSNNFLGVLTKHQLKHRKILKKANKYSSGLDELLVTDMMLTREKLMALDYEQISTANVSDVVRALQENGLHHILVIDHQQHHIRGLISANDVARKLRVPINIEQPPSFMHIFKAAI
ncbi:CBS domain-containing protein [Shewanella eurypsychrophilus]|uniref:CBS domain-containing protein n=1 Tax=Shewanella eurypsychrophilus TaxID=2593656 RepID=A0ABX6VAB1_9GAMM|nr:MULTISPECIES: CBS domain-containing protein [Shewanella]QFU23587.1 CBS domain-containing protein [Shewanella sp. YLB-09]QPG58811.1 CBS domain-containing protein [Shewanella eurypsychrophilus]